jgi:hypothetical protein
VQGDCDVEEKCDGYSADCPSDAVQYKGTVCRESKVGAARREAGAAAGLHA